MKNLLKERQCWSFGGFKNADLKDGFKRELTSDRNGMKEKIKKEMKIFKEDPVFINLVKLKIN